MPRSAVIWPSDADTLKRFMTMTMPAAMASTPINAEPPRAPLRAAPLSETPTSPPTLLLRPACRLLPAPGPCAARHRTGSGRIRPRAPKTKRPEARCFWPVRFLAPRVGFEPTTLRLTAGCSAVELPRNEPWRFLSRSRASEDYTGTQPLRKTEFSQIRLPSNSAADSVPARLDATGPCCRRSMQIRRRTCTAPCWTRFSLRGISPVESLIPTGLPPKTLGLE